MLSRWQSGGGDRSIKSPWSVRGAGSRLPWGGECPRSASQQWALKGRLQAEGVLGEGGKWVGQREEQLLQGEFWMVLQKSPDWRHGAFASPPPPTLPSAPLPTLTMIKLPPWERKVPLAIPREGLSHEPSASSTLGSWGLKASSWRRVWTAHHNTHYQVGMWLPGPLSL